MTWKRIKDFKVWIDRDKWSNEISGWEWSEPVRGIILVAHHKFMYEVPRKKTTPMWLISEKTSGLRLTVALYNNRKEALQAAIKVMEKYDDAYIQAAVQDNIIKQVRHQIGA